MPAYNEDRTIEEIVRKVLAVEMEKELIIVDDGVKAIWALIKYRFVD